MKGRVISVRLSDEEYEALKHEAEFYNKKLSEHIRGKLKPNHVMVKINPEDLTMSTATTVVTQPVLFEWR